MPAEVLLGQDERGRQESETDVLAGGVHGDGAGPLAVGEPGGDDAVVDGIRRRLKDAHG